MTLQRNAGAVRRFGKMMKFGAWLQTLPGKLPPPPFRLMQIGSAFWQSRALYVATRLDVATVLGDAKLDCESIATRVGADADALARLLRLLSALGVFAEAGPGIYRNNQVSAFLRQDHPGNVRAMILMHNSDTMSRPWYEQLEQGIRSGTPPFELTHGEELFAYLDGAPDFARLFSEAMDSVAALSGDSFATDFDWSRFRRIIDVGGARGSKSLAILRRHPGLQALVLDRPQVIAEARTHWAAHPDPDALRLEFQAGDLLQALPPARDERDIYLVSAVLHGMGQADCLRALRNLARASGDRGAPVVLQEQVMPATGADLSSASFDMQMFMGTRGRERTLQEWQRMFRDSGLKLEEIVALRSFGKLLVLRPQATSSGN